MKYFKKVIFLSGIMLGSIFLLVIIPSGEYKLDIFVFNNLNEPVSYSDKFTKTIII